jgi:hypothetical protein
MLYKVTPMMPSAEVEKGQAEREAHQPRAKRKSAVYDADGREVLITLTCLKCRKMKPLPQFGLRKMSDGAIRNQPWCRTCRGAAGTKKDATPEILSVVAGGGSEEGSSGPD